MGHNAFNTALEVLSAGFVGQAAVEEWFDRVGASGERFCPIAYEQLLLSGGGAVELAPGGQASAASVGGSLGGLGALGLVDQVDQVDGSVFIPPELFPGELVFPGVPGEPIDTGSAGI